ncbi:MAG TPA: hypothetical protein VG367_13075 [Mucilaginibacter sp.]|jgi:hypothetical protein|nr:hypothetical protein [Mucilaginibacter sp.]
MLFKNGKLVKKEYEYNSNYAGELLKGTNTILRKIVCNVINTGGSFRLETTITIILYGKNNDHRILKYVGEYNYDIENNGVSIEDDKIDLFKHLLLPYSHVCSTVLFSPLGENDEYRDENMPQIVDEVVNRLKEKKYYH